MDIRIMLPNAYKKPITSSSMKRASTARNVIIITVQIESQNCKLLFRWPKNTDKKIKKGMSSLFINATVDALKYANETIEKYEAIPIARNLITWGFQATGNKECLLNNEIAIPKIKATKPLKIIICDDL